MSQKEYWKLLWRGTSPDIYSFFRDNEKREWIYVYQYEMGTVALEGVGDVRLAGSSFDDPTLLLGSFSRAQQELRISTFDPAFDWLWGCLRATRDLRKGRIKGNGVHSGREYPQNQRMKPRKKAKKPSRRGVKRGKRGRK